MADAMVAPAAGLEGTPQNRTSSHVDAPAAAAHMCFAAACMLKQCLFCALLISVAPDLTLRQA